MNFLKEKLMNSDLGILLSLGTVLGYGMYFNHQEGFNYYYGLPSGYVSLNISNLALCFIVVYTFLGLIILTSGGISKAIEEFESPIFNKKNINRFLMGLATSVAGSLWTYKEMRFFNSINETGIVIELIATTCLIYIVWNLFKNLSMILALALVATLSLWLAYGIGLLQAINQDSYLVLKQGKQDYVIINTYDDKFIISPFDPKKRNIESKFQFIEMKSEKDNKLELSLMHTGSLKSEKYIAESGHSKWWEAWAVWR
ncbi:hypothetical protein IAE23_25760 [Bacillus sp. S35]|nr:hypothetical protein [Bacillus sp. S35]